MAQLSGLVMCLVLAMAETAVNPPLGLGMLDVGAELACP